MHVRSLLLRRIKGYHDERLFAPLTPGVILLLGRNGCGKTTLSEAIGLAVFGAIPGSFKGSAGSSLRGFISHGAKTGRIEAVVDVKPGRLLTFCVDLSADKPDDDSPTNLISCAVYAGDVRADATVTDGESLLTKTTRSALCDFIGREFSLRLGAEELFASLIAPAQSGGLTSYLKKTPKDREKQTEQILGLSAVREVAKVAKSLRNANKPLIAERADALERALTAYAADHPAFAPLLKLRGTKKEPFGTLDAAQIAGHTARARQDRGPGLQESSRALARAFHLKRATESALKQLQSALSMVRKVDGLRAQHATVQVECTRLEALHQEAITNQEEGMAFERAKTEGDALQAKRQQAQSAHARMATQGARLESQEQQLTIAGRERESLSVRLAGAVHQERARETELEKSIGHAKSDAKQGADALDHQHERCRVLATLLQVVEQVEGAFDEVLQGKLLSLKSACRDARLPQDAAPLVDGLERRFELQAGPSDAAYRTRLALIQGWTGDAQSTLQAKQAVSDTRAETTRGLETELASLRATLKVTHQRLLETTTAQEKHGASLAECKEALIAHAEGLKTTKDALQTFDEAWEKTQLFLSEEGREERWIQWKGALAEAAKLPAQKEALKVLSESFELSTRGLGVLGTWNMTAPRSSDPAGWRALTEQLTARADGTMVRLREQLEASATARRDHEQLLERYRSLDALEEGLLSEFERLMDARATHAELSTLLNGLLEKLPRLVAARVVGSVSQLADEFFQSLFVSGGAGLRMEWDSSDYGVKLHRGDRSQPADHASGGEQMAMGIALNLAVLHFMAPNVRWLLLDEPTASLDSLNREALRDFVASLQEGQTRGDLNLFDQLFFISHESDLFEGLGQSIFPEDA